MNRAAQVDLSGRRFIVTGATPGSLGDATARTLTAWGAEIVTTNRSGTSGRALDLSDARSVRNFVDWYLGEHDRLDVLVNNAGIHLDLRSRWKTATLTPDGQEIHWRTNYLGTMHLTHLLLPLLVETARQTGDARVVAVVSKLHARGRNEFLFRPVAPYSSWDAYGTSKLALIHAMNELSDRYAEEALRTYSVHPGSVYTHIADRGLQGHRVIGTLRRVAAPLERRMLLAPVDGAQTTLHCATAADLPSGYYRDCRAAEPSAAARDAAATRRLWAETEAWIARQT
jgi:NAD(P)-dependent dehydrogenase (short-subunit alcohol dehydrogenase family)